MNTLLFTILAILLIIGTSLAGYYVGKRKPKSRKEPDEKQQKLMDEFNQVMGYNLTKALERRIR